MSKKTDLKGKIIGFAHDDTFLVIETEFGKAYLDKLMIEDDEFSFKIGDEISVEKTTWYIYQGQVVTRLNKEFVLNGVRYFPRTVFVKSLK